MDKLWLILFSIGIAQGVFIITALSFLKNRKALPLSILIALVICYSLLLLPELLIELFSINSIVRFYRVGETIPLLIGPLFLYYTYAVVDKDYKIYKTNLIHLIPFVFFSLLFLPFYLKDVQYKLNYIEWRSNNNIPLRIALFSWFKGVHSVVYLIFSFIVVKSFRKNSQRKKPITFNLNLFQKLIFFQLIVIVIVYIAFTLQFFDKSVEIEADKIGAALITFSLYIYAFTVLKAPKTIIPDIEIDTKKYEKSSLDEYSAKKLYETIINYFEKNKPYLNLDFNLTDLSKKTAIPSHQISELLNQYKGTTFSDLVNTYRVKSAEKMLSDPKYKKLKITSIGYDSGFNSKTTFYHWFRKINNMTPAEYQRHHLEG